MTSLRATLALRYCERAGGAAAADVARRNSWKWQQVPKPARQCYPRLSGPGVPGCASRPWASGLGNAAQVLPADRRLSQLRRRTWVLACHIMFERSRLACICGGCDGGSAHVTPQQRCMVDAPMGMRRRPVLLCATALRPSLAMPAICCSPHRHEEEDIVGAGDDVRVHSKGRKGTATVSRAQMAPAMHAAAAAAASPRKPLPALEVSKFYSSYRRTGPSWLSVRR